MKKHEMDLPEQLAERAGVRLVRRPGTDLIAVGDAPAYLDACVERNVRVLGAEGFHLHGETLRADMSLISDLSSVSDAAESIAEARRFVAEIAAPDVMLDFTLDETAATDFGAIARINDERAETLSKLAGEHLAHVVFGGDLWLSLSFDNGAQLTLYRWPSVHQGDGLLSYGDSGYSDAIIALVGLAVVVAQQTSDYRLALEFEESKRLAVPLGGSLDDLASYDVAVLRGVRSETIGVWTAGELPLSP